MKRIVRGMKSLSHKMNVYLLPVFLDNSMPEPYLLCPADTSIDDDFTCLPGNWPLEQAFLVWFFFNHGVESWYYVRFHPYGMVCLKHCQQSAHPPFQWELFYFVAFKDNSIFLLFFHRCIPEMDLRKNSPPILETLQAL